MHHGPVSRACKLRPRLDGQVRERFSLTAMGRIQRLPEAVANQIAAGEVVERPASAVKELIENALDAGATRIEVDVEGGGVELLRVQDDGHGMPRADAQLALERHATSKIRTALDLERVATLGFRGEALPSIASVSRFELRTREPTSDEGTWVRVEGGHLSHVRAAGMPPGTSVEVRDLFYNVPARRKFLKRPETELSHIADAVERLALANHGVSLRLRSHGRTLLEVPRSPPGEERARVERILGGEIAGALVALPAWVPGAPVRVRGYVGHPSRSERSLRRLYTFVNGRFVRDRTIQHAISNVYRELLPPGRHPVGVLHLEVEPGLVDVNVHPQKLEVRFSDTGIVHRVLSGAVRAALDSEPAAPAVAANWAKAAGGQAREPWTPFERSAAPASHVLGRVIEAGLSRPWADQNRPRPAGAEDLPAGSGEAPAPRGPTPRVLACLPEGGLLLSLEEGGFEYLDLSRAEAALAFHRMQLELRDEGGVRSVPMLIPGRFEAPGLDAEVRSTLLGLGFELEPFGGATVVLKSVPRALGAVDPARLVELVSSALSAPRLSSSERESFLRRAAELVCVRSVNEAEARDLLRRLESAFSAAPPPWPFRLSWPRGELSRLFERA